MNRHMFRMYPGANDPCNGNLRWLLFFFLWSFGLVVMVQDKGVDASAMPIQNRVLPTFDALPMVPDVSADKLLATRFGVSLMRKLQNQSEVFSGRWQPPPSGTSETAGEIPAVSAVSVEKRAAALVVVVKHPSLASRSRDSEISQNASDGDSAGVSGDLADAVSDFSASSRLRKLRAREEIEQGNYKAAYLTLMRNLPEVTEDTEYYGLLGPILIQTRRFEQAAAVYASLLSIERDNPKWWAGYALSLEKLGVRETVGFAYAELDRLAEIDSPLKLLAGQKLKLYS